METNPFPPGATKLKILPFYTGVASLADALTHPQARRLLWLEILLNGDIDLEPVWEEEPVRAAYAKACSWYTTYKSLIDAVAHRPPLPYSAEPVDQRDYRLFAEALHFAATSSLDPTTTHSRS